MPADRRARDLDLLDRIDALPRIRHQGPLWRVARDGRDPLQGGGAPGRWSDGGFDVLYTSFARDGAIAEVHAYLDLQPVFPSKFAARAHRLEAAMEQALVFADLAALKPFGIEAERYPSRDYGRCQAIADAAYFLGFDGLIAPSARWPTQNAMLFTDRIAPADLILVASDHAPIDWKAWRAAHRRAGS